MSEVTDVIETEVKPVVEPVKEFFVLEKTHLQSFLDYLAKRPYVEVVELIEAMKTARQFVPAPVTESPQS